MTKLFSNDNWWEARRLKYTCYLFLSGFVAFVCYAVLLSLFAEKFPEAEITIFTILFQAVGFAFAVLFANIFYSLGNLIEKLVPLSKVEKYRSFCFKSGCIFSFSLPFLVPLIALIQIVE